MAYPEVVEEVASPSQLRLALGLSVALLASIALVYPYAATPLVALPHVSGMYGAATAMIDLATFWLLVTSSHQPRSHAVIAGAYLYGGLMAVLHVLSFPGAVFADGPVIGSPHAVSWMFIAWRAGFAFFIGWAALVDGRGERPGGERSSRLPVLAALVAVAVAYAGSQLSNVAALSSVGGRQLFSQFSIHGSYGAAVMAVLAIALILRRGLYRRSIFLWLMFVLTAEAAGVWLSTHSGGRYTLAWYTTRVEGMVASAVVLMLLARHFRQLQRDLAVAVDVLKARTDDLQAEIHRRENAEAKLAQAKKMEAVGQLGAGLSHDLNNILQVITGRLSILQRRAGTLADADVEVIRRNIRKAEAMTRQLTLLSGRRRMNAQTLNLTTALADIVDAVRPLLDGRYRAQLDVAPELPAVALDPLELEIALTNLMTNARDAMPEGGDIELQARVALRVEEGASEDRRRGQQNGQRSGPEGREAVGRHLLISVRDTGAGIRPEVLDRIFEPFFTTKEPGKGTGLGLAQVYGFAKASGGHVEVDSEPGRGTAVTMVFPLSTAPDGTDEEADPLAAVPVKAGQVILLVDDNDDVREASQQLLVAGGFVVRAASSAPEALRLLEAGLLPDVLISDIVMPGGMHGVELARQVRSSLPRVRVVLVTGYSDVAQSASDEGYPVIRKPYDLASLLRVLA